MGVTIKPAPRITPATSGTQLREGVVGASYESPGLEEDPGSNSITLTGGVAPYTWSVTSGLLPDGLDLASPEPGAVNIPGQPVTSSFICTNLSPALPCVVVKGTPKTSQITSFTLQVTDAVGVSDTMPLNIVVRPKNLKVPKPILVTPAIVNRPYPPTAFTVANGIPPFLWSTTLPPSVLSFSPDGVLSGTPQGQGPNEPVMTVVDSQSPVPAKGRLKLDDIGPNSIFDDGCASGAEGQLSSQAPYAFLLKGFDADGPVTIAGSFNSDGNGGITSGVMDINRASGVQTGLAINPSGSSYTLVGNRGCLTLVNSAGTMKFRLSMGGLQGTTLTRGRIIEFDDADGTGTRASGVVRLQDPTSFSNDGLNGLYAFGFSGWNSAGAHFAMAGSGSAASGTFSSIAADINNGGVFSPALTGGTGTYSISSSGRGTASWTVGSQTFDLAVYVVSSSSALFVTTNTRGSAHPVIGGETALTKGPFSSSSLKDNHIFYTTGLTSSGPDATVGVLSFNGSGKFADTTFEDNSGIPVLDPNTGSFALLTSGDYLADTATGRVSLSGSKAGSNPPVIYAVPGTSGVTGFIVGTGPDASLGHMEYQVANPPLFVMDSIKGNYFFGTSEPADSSTSNLEGTVIVQQDGSVVSSTRDVSDSGTDGLNPNQGIRTQLSIQIDGSGLYGGNNAFVANGSTLFYIDESPINLHPSVTILEK
jgi:hypothetical protein